jgi:4-hydroxybutyrate CoA-transferase
MKKMKIGIKYCGGCRASFNRKKFIDNLIANNDGLLFESAKEDVEYNILIVVNGCKTACANHTEYKCK